MKNLNQLLLLSSLSLMFFACGDDDSNGGNPLDDLVGTYNSTGYAMVNCTDPLDDEEIADGMCGAEPCLVLTITAGGNYSVVVYFETPTETQLGTLTIDGNKLTICEGGTDCQTFTYSLKGNSLTLEGSPDDCDLEINFEKV